MKKVFSVLLVALLILGCMPVTAFAADGSLSISGSAATAKAGETATVSFTVSGDPFAGFELNLDYDHDVLTLKSMTGSGAFIPAGDLALLASMTNMNDFTFSATFEVATTAKSGTYDITVSGIASGVNDEDGSFIELDVNPGTGSITIEGEPEPPAHEHTWSDWEVTTAATCTEKGVETRTCACGETETRDIAALGHDLGEWTVTKEASCNEAGEKTRSCSRCDYVETEEIPAGEHNYGAWTFCGTDAKHEHKKVCSVCGDEVVADCNDKLQYTDKTTVEEDGVKYEVTTEYWQCVDCGNEFDVSNKEEIKDDKPDPEDPNLDDVPRTDDITGQVVMTGAAALVAMLAAVAFIFKRKAAK